MSEAESSNPSIADLKALFDTWRSCTQDVLSQISGQPNTFEVALEPFAASDSDLRYTIETTGAEQGEIGVQLSLASGLRLARKFLGETDAAKEGQADQSLSEQDHEALDELLRQIGGLAATAVGANVGGPIEFRLSRADAPWTWTSDHVAVLRTRDEAGTEIAISMRVSPTLVSGLTSRAAAKAAAESAPASVSEDQTPSATDSTSQGSPAIPGDALPQTQPIDPEIPVDGYRRLFDVGLGVKLRFGTRRMLLRDVLALSAGLVVELDNKLNSPVDLLLDGRVIARGEVVVIDGKYGLRVTDVLNPTPSPATPS